MNKMLSFWIYVPAQQTRVSVDVDYSEVDGITMTVGNPTPDFPDVIEPALEQYINDNINILTPLIRHEFVFDKELLPRYENTFDRLEQKRVQITTVVTRAIVTEVIVPKDFELTEEAVESFSMDIAMQCAVDDDSEYLQKTCLDNTALNEARVRIHEQEIVGEVTSTMTMIS